MTVVRTLKDGPTVSDRAVFSGDDTTIPIGGPAVSEHGYNMHGADRVHVYATLGASITSIGITPYFRSRINDVWYAGTAVTLDKTGDGPRAVILEGAGEEYVFFEFSSVVGTGSIVLHAGYSFAEPGRDG